MDKMTIVELMGQWKSLTAPEILEKIAFYRVKFTEERESIKKETGETPWKKDVSCYNVLKSLFIELNGRLLNGEEITLHYKEYISPEGNEISLKDVKVVAHTTQFTSDKDGNFYFDGCKIIVEHNYEWAVKLRKTKIVTSKDAPVDFYLEFLDQTDKFTTDRNLFGGYCEMICEKYKPKK